ncbi:hypothetical protein WK78_15015 [Burkholderia cepacia]|nr:hypothetical protein WK78_15015 [Burkholderia cepacia]
MDNALFNRLAHKNADRFRQLQRFASVHGQVSNLFMGCHYHRNAQHKRQARAQAFTAWERVSCARMAA